MQDLNFEELTGFSDRGLVFKTINLSPTFSDVPLISSLPDFMADVDPALNVIDCK